MLTAMQRTLLEALAERPLGTVEVSKALGFAPTTKIPSTARALERRGLIGRSHYQGRVPVWELADAGRAELAKLRRSELRVVRPANAVRSPDADDAA